MAREKFYTMESVDLEKEYRLTLADSRVLGVLVGIYQNTKYRDEYGKKYACPSYQQLSEYTNLSIEQIRKKSVPKLRKLGLIVSDGQPYKKEGVAKRYYLNDEIIKKYF
ncbi:hypothetical protein N4T77_01635 [Clostridium sp. CX1]|uniref:Helix-turn-helix domain-containing protein n=1 Tax=Clostridium tanneri TaxID=3037988 RepID=A0ABU4JQ09_9CLOT|nr:MULTISPECIES: hypothetical protein [unclassified Clostridium]MCT8975291.1 hypothetical protein [Clostridium sp. CX1]MDW8800215.1 hypothetical protein [Clostridium sp. A1-XYC3]